MHWFKCLNPNHPLMLEAVDAVGKHGVFEIMQAISEAMAHDVIELDVKMLSRWASVKRDRAERLLPYAQQILHLSQDIPPKTVGNLKKSTGNVPEISEKSTENLEEILSESHENLVDFDASNPRGRIKDRETRVEREELTTFPSVTSLVLKEKNTKKESSDRATLVPKDWVPPESFWKWLTEKLPDFSRQECLEEVDMFINYCLANGKKYLDHEHAFRNWMKSPFRKPKSQSVEESGECHSAEYLHNQNLLTFQKIQNTWEPEWIIPREELSTKPNTYAKIFYQGRILAAEEFVGVSE